MTDGTKTSRNVLIIAALALALAMLPRGGDALDVAFAAAQAAFLAAICAAGRQLYRRGQFGLDALPDRFRGLLYGSIALAVVSLAASSRFGELGDGGFILLLGLLAAASGGLFLVWREYRSNAY